MDTHPSSVKYETILIPDDEESAHPFEGHPSYGTNDEADAGRQSNRHSCSMCNISFPTKQSLKRHSLVRRTVQPEKPLSCPHCPFTILHGGNMRQHLKRHTNPSQLSCDICSKTFCRAQLYTQHVNSISHLEAQARSESGPSYILPDIIGPDNNANRNPYPIPPVPRVFPCLICPNRRAFTHEAHLKAHVNRYHARGLKGEPETSSSSSSPSIFNLLLTKAR